MELSRCVGVLVTVGMLLLGGCATVSYESSTVGTGYAPAEQERKRGPTYSAETGLTQEGCENFFPLVNPGLCLTLWSNREYLERLTYLQSKGSLEARVYFSELRSQIRQELAQESWPVKGRKEIQNFIEVLYSKKYKGDCLMEKGMHPDVCIFIFEELVTPEELVDVLIDVPRRQDHADTSH